MPLVSVIIPYFNKKNHIKDAVNSVLNQTFKNIEIIKSDPDNNLLYLSGVPYTKVPNSKIIDRIVQLVENKLKEKN